MDWFSWLSKTGLDPSFVHQYALSFVQNELQQDDIAYFSHDLLQSIGINVAKHRLEILKLAMKEKGTRIHPMLWFIFTIKHTKAFLAKHVRCLVHDENPALVPKRNCSLKWKVSMLQRNKKLRTTIMPERLLMLTNGDYVAEPGQKFLMLTNGSPKVTPKARAQTQTHTSQNTRWIMKKVNSDDWSSSVEEIKWETMFQNLKPT